MYFKLDESFAHSSLNFLLELAMQLQKYIWISRIVGWIKCIYKMTNCFIILKSNLTDKFVPAEYNIIYANYRVLLGWQEVQMS